MTTLTERLATRAKKTALQKGQGRAAFLALKPDIQEALKNGWIAKEIWSLLKDEGKIGVSYSLFLRYIREHIVSSGARLPAPAPQLNAVDSEPVASKTQQATAPAQFNIDSQPNRRDLV